ncbi:MAG: hypothetical protein CMB99_00820 [Flavobacteriaceae bacterium]|nr:hypothetical protein [Flavobacteriaceae bacterium]|tara:strand:+ start:5698 stop:10365 length:4668 start_codon:yes stop_codon:yes gene_type:complete
MSEQLIAEIEEAAHSGAHGLNAAPCPSDKQHVAGNYKKGRIAIQGMPVVIEQPRYSLRTGVSYMGEHWSCRMAAHYGYFAGVPGADGDELDVFIGPVPDAETLYIVNQVLGGNFDEHKVMLGFADESQARNAYLNSYDRNWQGLGSMVPVSINDFKKWIASGVPARAVVPSDFKKGVSRMQSLLLKHISWDSAAKPVGSNLDRVLYDLRRKDDDPEMFYTPMTMDSIKDDADDEGTFDSLVMPFAQMERKMDVVQRVLNRTSSELEVSNLEISEPFTSAGSANVAAIFTLSDGQTVTIYMHNPDTTPKKIMPTDEVVSWKWLLNRTDITIAVAPERGQDLNIREVARRIMKLAEKNMTRFAAAQKRAADTRAMIEEAEAANDQLETELADAKAELASLQAIQADYQASLSASGAAANAEQIGERNGDIVSGEVPAEGMYVVLSHAPGYLGRGKEGYEGYSVPPKDLGDVRYAPVSSMKEASEVVRGFIDRNELGASNFNGGQVYQDGVQVAHISYNGRAWSGADRFAADKQEIDISEGAVIGEKVEKALIDAGWTKGDDGAFRRTLSSDGESMAVRVLYEDDELRAYEGDEIGQMAFVAFPDGDKSIEAAVSELYGLVDDELEAKIERNSVTLDGDELGNFADDEEGKKARRAATRDYLDSLRGQMVNVPALDADVEIRKRGIKKTMTMTGNPLKLKMLAGLKQLIATARTPVIEKNHKVADKRSVELYYRLSNRVSIDGERHNVTVLIEKDVNGMLHYDLLLEAKTKTALDSASAVDADQSIPDNHSGDEPTNNNGTEPDAGQVLDNVALDDTASGSLTGNMVLNLFIEGEAPEMVAVEPLNVSPEEAVTPEGYAKLVDADALDDYADVLDAAFSDRIYQVRARLFDLGWDKRSESEAWPLVLGEKSIYTEFRRSSSGANNVGVIYSLRDIFIEDEFKDVPSVIADRIHKLAGFEIPAPDSLLPAGVRLAEFLKGMGWEYSVDAENPNFITASYGDTLGAFSVDIEDDNGKLFVDGHEINALSLSAYASDLHEEMMSDDMSELYEMYGLSASEDASNYRDEAFVKALHMAVELIKRKGGRVNFGNFDASLSGGLFDAAEVPAKARIIAQIVDVQTNEPVGRLAVDGNAITIYRGLSGDDTVIEESRRITDVGEALTGLLSGKPNDNEDQAASAGSEYTVLRKAYLSDGYNADGTPKDLEKIDVLEESDSNKFVKVRRENGEVEHLPWHSLVNENGVIDIPRSRTPEVFETDGLTFEELRSLVNQAEEQVEYFGSIMGYFPRLKGTGKIPDYVRSSVSFQTADAWMGAALIEQRRINGLINDNYGDDKKAAQKLKNQALDAISKIKAFIPDAQFQVLAKNIRASEEATFFANKIIELKERIDTMAKTYEQDGKGMNATAYLHYFGGSYDAYITEKDMDGGVDQAFGWASFGQGGELGYISIADITKQPGIELDLHFDPKSLNQALGRGTVEESEPALEPSTPAPESSPEQAPSNPDNDYLNQVIAGELDLTDNAVIEEIEAIAGRIEGDSAMEEKLTSAINAVEKAMLEATNNMS